MLPRRVRPSLFHNKKAFLSLAYLHGVQKKDEPFYAHQALQSLIVHLVTCYHCGANQHKARYLCKLKTRLISQHFEVVFERSSAASLLETLQGKSSGSCKYGPLRHSTVSDSKAIAWLIAVQWHYKAFVLTCGEAKKIAPNLHRLE
ncbi:hypothetical protein M404DRAFT_770127 [Pisolithus tinctorius Marx 270]|uniref:Uncharacterized protein n=1 Tax=Pisolithus tinctorius Marx 270 TaxID=870435 RepID=A0A0C3JRL2_PISTI|nr:hypothetical protein M404DRAFT_770127 [Pisolithus tinctorius Marx 270]